MDLAKHRTWPHRILPPGREITFKTDPEKGDYELETGASRNFESWTDKQATEKEHKEARYVHTKRIMLFWGGIAL